MKEIRFFRRDRAQFEFLSNFFHFPIAIGGRVYPTVEHFFQASKAVHEADHERVRLARDPKGARRLGKKVVLRPDWEAIKEEVMLRALRAKFAVPGLRKRLVETGDARLVEDSPFDLYWGTGRHGKGLNRLGELLMKVREDLRDAGGC